MVKKEVLIWIPVIIVTAILYYSVKEEKVPQVDKINDVKPVETVQTVKKESFVGIEDEQLSTAIDKIDPELYRQKEHDLLQGRRYTIDNSLSKPLRKVILTPEERNKSNLALKSLESNHDYEMTENKIDYSLPTIKLDIKRNPKIIESANRKKYELNYDGVDVDKDVTLTSNTTNFEQSIGNLGIAIKFDYSDDMYKPQRDIYDENGSVRNPENDVYPENYMIEHLEQTLKLRLDGVKFTKLLDVPNNIVLRTKKSPQDYNCSMDRRYFSNIGSSFNADYSCDGLPNINDYEGNIEIIFKK